MKTCSRLVRTLTCVLGLASTSIGFSAADTPTSPLADAIGGGKVSLNVRLRYEYAEQDGLRASNAITVRPRLGYTTNDIGAFKAMIEFENVTALDGDAYNQAGLNPGGAGRTVIADPTTTEVNQAWLSWAPEGYTFKAGRQRIVYDNARFVGDVGWRQNMQTFDAVSAAFNPVDALTVNYAYLWQVNRVFGRDHAQGAWDSDSHLLNAAFKLPAGGTLAGYAYVLDFDNAAAMSTNTLGLSFTGSQAIGEGVKLNYRAEYAHQSDAANNAADFSTDYILAEIGPAFKGWGVAVGYEILGSDNGQGFRTPLATLHAFNGWNDVFLATPGAGLRDLYLKASATLTDKISLLGFYHRFDADTGGADFGDEFDLQCAYKIDKNITAILKGGMFNGDTGFADVNKVWLQFDFAF
jgi:hypothetical protein